LLISILGVLEPSLLLTMTKNLTSFLLLSLWRWPYLLYLSPPSPSFTRSSFSSPAFSSSSSLSGGCLTLFRGANDPAFLCGTHGGGGGGDDGGGGYGAAFLRGIHGGGGGDDGGGCGGVAFLRGYHGGGGGEEGAGGGHSAFPLPSSSIPSSSTSFPSSLPSSSSYCTFSSYRVSGRVAHNSSAPSALFVGGVGVSQVVFGLGRGCVGVGGLSHSPPLPLLLPSISSSWVLGREAHAPSCSFRWFSGGGGSVVVEVVVGGGGWRLYIFFLFIIILFYFILFFIYYSYYLV